MSLKVVATLLALGFTTGSLPPGKRPIPPDVDVDTSTDDSNDDTVGFFTGLYNIDSDPDENTNLYDDDSYTDVLAEFVAKNDKWKELVIDPEVPTQDDMYTTFASLGGIGAWVESSFTPTTITQKYDYSDAPNIVFVLVDDWGYNDPGYQSTYLSWTTPNIDSLASEGIILKNYFSNQICIPSRGALLTGRYPLRLGLWGNDAYSVFPGAELPLSEITLAQELKSAGYRTYAVGKWDLGMSTKQHYPTNRGFDSFYGYLDGMIDYYTKKYDGYLDLQTDTSIVTEESEISSDLHDSYLFQTKAEAAIWDWKENYSDEPFFLYYATHIIHGPLSAPSEFIDRCEYPSSVSSSTSALIYQKYCALNLMLDNIIANLTCTLESAGMSDNTILIVASDNGGANLMPGNSYPYKGNKGSFFRGGVSVPAFIHSKLIPESVRGTEYEGYVHVTDWLPTLLGRATDGEWSGGYSDQDIDGEDLWDAITTNDASSGRDEIVFYSNGDACAIQYGNYRYLSDLSTASTTDVAFIAEENDDAYVVSQTCDSPSLVDDDSDSATIHSQHDAKSTESESAGFTSLYFLPSAGSYAYVVLFMLLIGLMASPFVISKMAGGGSGDGGGASKATKVATPLREDESQLPLCGEQRSQHYGSVNAI